MSTSEPDSSISEAARRWLAFAEEDLRIADLALGVSLYNQVCFHAHQAAEKTHKALIVYNGADPPKTHRLTEPLILIQGEAPALREPAGELRSLESYFISTRYPDALPGSLSEGLPGKDEAREALAAAWKVSQMIRGIIENLE